MARGFTRTRRGVVGVLDDAERAVLDSVLADVEAMLAEQAAPAEGEDPLAAMVGIDAGAQRPEDPAVARLVPDASRDDDEAAGEFRRYTQRGLLDRKRQRLADVRATLARRDEGEKLVLAEDEAHLWVAALTDVRLVLGERLGLRTDEDAAALHERVEAAFASGDDVDPEEGHLVAVAALYDVLTWWQETLAEALLEGMRREERRARDR